MQDVRTFNVATRVWGVVGLNVLRPESRTPSCGIGLVNNNASL
jgi:hypothetical protein